MNLFGRKRVAGVMIAGAIAPQVALAQTDKDDSVEEVQVYGEAGESNVATKLALTVMEVPQTVTTISQAQLQDFGLNKLNDVLNYAPGITVEEIETDRTYYTARGFDIVNFQYDGVGIPFVSGLSRGQLDTSIYDKIEVVKGAAGLISGLANPSATINYVRKRPSDEFKASAGLSLNEWSGARVDGDVSGSLSSVVSGRLVVAYDRSDSYLDRHSDETKLAYGVMQFDFTDTSKLTIGHAYDNSHSEGVLWGALPLLYTDYTQTDFDVSTSNAPDWTFANSSQQQTFVELEQGLGENWSLNIQAVYNVSDYDSELFYTYGLLDPDTLIGLNGWASAYTSEETQKNGDIFLNGSFDLFGQTHQLVVGYSYSDTKTEDLSLTDPVNGFPVLSSDWAEGNTPAPTFSYFDPATDAGDVSLRQQGLYASSRLNVTDSVAVLLGARQVEIEQSGISYGSNAYASADEVVPYYGVTWDVIDSVTLYASYSEVFKQQTWVDENLAPLGPVMGESNEFGIKKSFNDGRAALTVARFASEQSNFGEFIGRNDQFIAIYEGTELSSRGVR